MEIKRVLLTGCQGSIGTRLVQPLEAAGFEVRCQDLFGSFRSNFVSGDLSSPVVARKAVQGMQAVVHLAGGKPLDKDITQKNLASTMSLIEACGAEGVRRCLFASTINIYGQGSFRKSQTSFTPPYFPIDERIQTVPEDDYSLSKLEGERLFHQASTGGGMQTLAVRFPAIWPAGKTDAYQPPSWHERFSPLRLIDPWHYLDQRDLSEAVITYLRLAKVPNFAAGYLTASDLAGWSTTEEMLSPERSDWLALWKTKPRGYQPLFCSATICQILDWRPRYRWRDIPHWRRRLNRVKGLLF